MAKLFKIYKTLTPWLNSYLTVNPKNGTHVVVEHSNGTFFEGVLHTKGRINANEWYILWNPAYTDIHYNSVRYKSVHCVMFLKSHTQTKIGNNQSMMVC